MTCLWSKHATRVHAVDCARGLHANLVESDLRAAASRVPLSTASRPYSGREAATVAESMSSETVQSNMVRYEWRDAGLRPLSGARKRHWDAQEADERRRRRPAQCEYPRAD